MLLVAVVLVSGCAPSAAAATDPAVTVSRVVDGDTVHAGGMTIRVLGIDSPETVKPNTPVQCGGREASAFAHRLLDGQHVTLVADPTQADVDRYKRTLRYIRLADGTDYSTAIVAAGWARVYTYQHRPVLEYQRLEQAQQSAVAARRGLWGTCPNPKPGD